MNKVYVVLDDSLYIVSKEDADKLDRTFQNADAQNAVMQEMEKKYKPIQKRIDLYRFT